jgi:hypothetical protein
MASADYVAAKMRLNAVLGGPQRASNTVGSVEMPRIPDIIAGINYAAGVDAANSRTRGLRFNRFVPEGANGAGVQNYGRVMFNPNCFDRIR